MAEAIETHEEQVARHAAGVPVALLLKAADLADAGTRRHRHHGCVGGMVHARERQLPFARRRTAQRADLAVRPVLLGDPAECVVTVCLRQAENFILAFGAIAAFLFFDYEHITALTPPLSIPLHRPPT